MKAMSIDRNNRNKVQRTFCHEDLGGSCNYGTYFRLMPWPFIGPKMFCADPNFFVPDQKFIHILWQSQTFCARQKDDLHSVKLVFVPAQKVLKRH